MLSTIPIDLSEIDTKNVDKEILRASIMLSLTQSIFMNRWLPDQK